MQLPIFDPPIKWGKNSPTVYGCPRLETSFYRPRTCWAPNRKTPGAIALLAEEADWRVETRKIFVLWFKEFRDTGELLAKLQEINLDYQIADCYTRLTQPEKDFLNFFNSDQKFRHRISTRNPPKMDGAGGIDYHLELIQELTRPGRQRLFFPENSPIPRLLQSVSDLPTATGIKDVDHPAAAAVVYGIAALYHQQTIEPEEMRATNYRLEPKPVDWRSYDPFAADHPANKYDVWTNILDERKE